MAFDKGEGFDKYGTDLTALAKVWGGSTAHSTLESVSPRSGNAGPIYLKQTDFNTELVFNSVRASSTVGVAFRITAVNGSKIFTIRNSGTLQLQVDIGAGTSGHLEIYNGDKVTGGAGTKILDLATSLLANTWYYLELGFTINTTTGALSAKVWNETGSTLLSSGTASNVNTDPAGVGTADRICFFTNATSVFIDDLYIADTFAEFYGPGYVQRLAPTGAGTTTQWTPLTGSNWSEVNEAPPDGDTSYNSTATQNNEDTFATADLTLSGVVPWVQTSTQARLESGTNRTIAHVIRSSGTDYVGANATIPSTTYVDQLTPWQNNPAGGSWTVTSVNAAEVGYKLTGSGALVTRVTQCQAEAFVSPDTTPPTFSSASVSSDGLSCVVELTETGSPPILPASSVTGYTVKSGGVSQTISSVSRTASTEDTIVLSAPILKNATVTLDYTPGNVTDSALNAMLAFSGQSVTNNSTVTANGGGNLLRGSGGTGTGKGRGHGPPTSINVSPANVIYGLRRR